MCKYEIFIVCFTFLASKHIMFFTSSVACDISLSMVLFLSRLIDLLITDCSPYSMLIWTLNRANIYLRKKASWMTFYLDLASGLWVLNLNTFPHISCEKSKYIIFIRFDGYPLSVLTRWKHLLYLRYFSSVGVKNLEFVTRVGCTKLFWWPALSSIIIRGKLYPQRN